MNFGYQAKPTQAPSRGRAEITRRAICDQGRALQSLWSGQFFQQRLRLLQIGGIEPLGEPAVEGGKEVVGLGGLAPGVP